MLTKEGRAEHLVGREAADQRRVVERAGIDVAAKKVLRHGPEVAGHLADDDVRAVMGGHLVQQRERVRRQGVVLVHELHVLAVRRREADVARPAGPARVGGMDDPDVRVSLRQHVEPRRGLVGRSVIDVHDLQLVARHRLREQRVDAGLDERTRVVDGYDDGDLDQWSSLGLFLALGSRARTCSVAGTGGT